MFTVGIIGAGSIAAKHIEAYKSDKNCYLKSIADINEEQLKNRVSKYQIENAYTDYHEILADDEIDAVDIVTPTFTHKDIIIEALKSGKHVICEKPPTRNAKEAIECKEAAEKYGKVLMYTFVFRFSAEMQYLKEYAEAGKFGDFVCAEATRLTRCASPGGWMLDKAKAGGSLLDGTIHEIDSALYIMGYPKVKSVTGFSSDVNQDLPEKMRGLWAGYKTTDKTPTKRTVDSVTGGYVIFENGSLLNIKSGSILNVIEVATSVELIGSKAGAKLNWRLPDDKIKILEITDNYYFSETVPKLATIAGVPAEIAHFIDCCTNGTECICKLDESVALMEIIDAIYKSAETGKTIYFD